ncbi:MAG: peptidase M15A [Spirulina sp. SIO3F2]|nr:peptidase M15A [Spirulina sp. SIO3F2]
MAQLTPEQRNVLYLRAAGRAGIHKSLLAALYAAHRASAEPITTVDSSVRLADGETGLGLEPTDCPTFPEQVAYGANVIRVLSDRLIAQSWQGKDLWYPAQGRYSDRFLEIIADGFTPAAEDTQVALLKSCNVEALKTAYQNDIDQTGLPEDLSQLDEHLLSLVERLPELYWSLSHQRQACLEAVRIWRNLNTTEAAIESLAQETNKSLRQLAQEDLDITLKQFVQRSVLQYQHYPYQREALIRLVQYWRQLPSREATLVDILRDPQPHANLQLLDSVLLHFVTTLPAQYLGKGIQRNALTEAFRVWRQLDSRSTAITALGVDTEILGNATPEPETLQTVAQQLDRELLSFADRIPRLYRASHQHRESLIRLVQLWRELPTREQTIQSLASDHQQIEQTVPPLKLTISLPQRPATWTLENLELTASILPDGQFTWAHATQCGTCWPPNEPVIAAIIQIATLLERAQRQVGQPFMINRWYQPLTMQRAWKTMGEKRHILGDAVEFICPGLTANQLYWALDPWWPGGLGRYTQYPLLCHLDARPYRARWQQE